MLIMRFIIVRLAGRESCVIVYFRLSEVSFKIIIGRYGGICRREFVFFLFGWRFVEIEDLWVYLGVVIKVDRIIVRKFIGV